MTSMPGMVSMVVDSIMANLHSTVAATSPNANPAHAMNQAQSNDDDDDEEEEEEGGSSSSDNSDGARPNANEAAEREDERLDPDLVDRPLSLIAREPGSRMVVRYHYDDVVRRIVISSDITLDEFKQLIERKTKHQFDKLYYFHQNTPVDIFDEDEFCLAIASRHEPYFYFRQRERSDRAALASGEQAPPDHSGLLGSAPDMDNPPAEHRPAGGVHGDDRADCMPRSLAARLNGAASSSASQPASESPMLSFYELRTVRRLWKEYAEGIDGRPSIRSLEEEHGPTWRRNRYQPFQRRMRIVREIQRRAESIGIEAAIEELDRYGSLHKVTEALRARHLQSPEGRRRRDQVVHGIRRRRQQQQPDDEAAGNVDRGS
ncbi:transcriptional activator of glycolytic enzymes-domain-containing protein [Syncephalis pseudoplumigaleata]|uniref:Transcriptional activator of glycolytic enzymes-domain-containing protein n=1 Tax=Syncephalis pseudoplumigaleata TaxID=1712513 RepID=A0A4P9YYI2_9FUNG|nr:transcriptional activator of glycolytic enzymes-domain-containing protein [Syncephalis pseudoplumigaleata]|eukprot:RKP25157.1 transcriptional activator of glycolytic enzymes-domain-containing protein [Syncephalis pseudoplumigaleata]